MGEPRPAMPGYPPAMTTLTDVTTGPVRWLPTRVTAAVLAFGTVLLVIVGSFLPLYRGSLGLGAGEVVITVSPWSADVEGAPQGNDQVPAFGYPLILAAIVLAVAAAMIWYAATPAASPGIGRVASVTMSIGAAFLVGTVWTIALVVMNGIETIVMLGASAPGLETEGTYLTGFWLLIIAATAATAAAALALIPVGQRTWLQANPDATTPPYGLALPPQQQQPEPPGPPLLQVDPLTGRPLPTSPPAGFPAQPPATPPGGTLTPQPFTSDMAPPQPAVWQTFAPAPGPERERLTHPQMPAAPAPPTPTAAPAPTAAPTVAAEPPAPTAAPAPPPEQPQNGETEPPRPA